MILAGGVDHRRWGAQSPFPITHLKQGYTSYPSKQFKWGQVQVYKCISLRGDIQITVLGVKPRLCETLYEVNWLWKNWII